MAQKRRHPLFLMPLTSALIILFSELGSLASAFQLVPNSQYRSIKHFRQNYDYRIGTNCKFCKPFTGTNSPNRLHMLHNIEVSSLLVDTAGYQDILSSTLTSAAASVVEAANSDKEAAEALAGPLFGASLFPYLAFLYFLDFKENDTPKGITVGFATCLLFVFLTIPAAIASQLLYGVSLADCDWLHGSAESMLTITNLITVLSFRQALRWKEEQQMKDDDGDNVLRMLPPPPSVVSYAPMISLVCLLTVLAAMTAIVPALFSVVDTHTPYLGGFLDLPPDWVSSFGNLRTEPENALTVATWIIHLTSLVEFLVAMGFAWKWADVVGNKRWKGITWGLLPLHSSGITACIYHLFYNHIPFLVPLQAFLTVFGNTTAAYAAYRLALSNGWKPPPISSFYFWTSSESMETNKDRTATTNEIIAPIELLPKEESPSLIGFEDLGDALSDDTDLSFVVKLFVGCAIASYVIKYAELQVDLFTSSSSLTLGFLFVFIPSALNAFKWYKRSRDPTFEGWF
mmetsp:Transcript_2989/g.4508  ORF Transcript_2989/g.4508 Transcript_2989/m.4508 type:complete len:514 (-) Transcript_2989:86-1627(-)